MKNNCLKSLLIGVCSMALLSSSAKAQLTVDFGSIGGEVSNFVTKISENVTEVVEPVAEQYESIKKGVKGAVEASDVVKQAKEKFEEGKRKIDEAKQKIGEYKEAADKVKGVAGDLQSKAESAKEGIEGAAEKAQQAKAQAEAKANYLTVKEELDDLQAEKQRYIDDESAKYQANIEALRYNNEIYRQKKAENISLGREIDAYDEEIEKNNKSIEILKEEKAAIMESETVQKYDEDIAAKEEILKQREEEIKQITEKAAEKAKAIGATVGATAGTALMGALGGILGGKGAAAYDSVANQNFVPEGEVAGGELMGKLAQQRKKMAADDAIYAYVVALEIRQQKYDNNEMIEDLKKSMAEVEDAKSSVLTETSGIRVKAMKNILDFIKLQLAELKMETSLDMLDVPYEYKRKTTFNFDDYVFTKEDATGEKEKSWMEKAKGLKDKTEKTIEEGKQKVEDTKKQVEDTKKQVEDTVNDTKNMASDLDFKQQGQGE